MSKTAMVRARIEPELKEHAEAIIEQLGLSVTQTITLLYKQIELQNGLPFDISLPNEQTQKTFAATDKGEELISCESVDDMFDKLDI